MKLSEGLDKNKLLRHIAKREILDKLSSRAVKGEEIPFSELAKVIVGEDTKDLLLWLYFGIDKTLNDIKKLLKANPDMNNLLPTLKSLALEEIALEEAAGINKD